MPDYRHDEEGQQDGQEMETSGVQEFERPDGGEEQLEEGEQIYLLSAIPSAPRDRLLRKGSGRRSKSKSGTNKGRYAAFTQHKTPKQRDLALDATPGSYTHLVSFPCAAGGSAFGHISYLEVKL